MTLHLNGRAGCYRLLIPTASVLEVWEASVPAGERVSWRDRMLPYVDGRRLLGLAAGDGARVLVAYGGGADDPAASILGLDEVAGAVAVPAASIRPFPAALHRAHRLFDAVAELGDAPEGVLRMRPGLDLSALAAQSFETMPDLMRVASAWKSGGGMPIAACMTSSS